ncbi:sugar phosphate nucleotidyltransferase [Phosphitispora sp. TUW77]|uniref:sugar phosphate nucleotidyltransferase n=1 Tax=Phosphitispora sp. TUW77 TaxID=3152361 RepID=UPI003AB67775
MVQSIIMAGGEGSRLRPLTCNRPKPMVPMLNRPVIEYAVELLKRHGIKEIGVTLQYMPQEIQNYFGDGSGFGVNMEYFIENTPLGTAGSVKNAQEFLKDTFVVVSGDALTDFDLTEAIRFHRDKGAIATLVLTPVEIPLEYGVVITEDSGSIRQFLEKPGWGEVFSDTVNTGIYILEPEVLKYIPENTQFDFSKDLFPYLLRENMPLFGVSLRGYWCDIGNLKQYQEAHFAAMEGRVNIEVKSAASTENGIYTGDNCRIDPGAIINAPVFIGDNCHIGPGAEVGPYVVVGSGCRVDNNASIKRTIVWNGSYIGNQAEIRGAVICDKVVIKDRAAVFEGAVIGEESIIEENARIKPNTNIWPHKLVERSMVVDSHFVWGTKACRNLFGSDGVSGKININLTAECAAKLGAVYGTVTGPGETVLVSSDYHRSTKMIKNAIIAGLMSVGIMAADGGTLVTPVHRHAVRALAAKGGIHVKSSFTNSDTININLFTGNGAMISRDVERKIENLFERDDFQRKTKEQVGTATYMPGLTESYVRSLLDMVGRDEIRKKQYRIAAIMPGEGLHSIVPYVFNELGCELVETFEGNSYEYTGFEEMKAVAEKIAAEAAESGLDMGVIFDSNAEHVILIDGTGQILDDNLFTALMSAVILDSSREPVVAVPVTGSRVVETMAETKNGTVIRTKTSPVVFMHETMKPELVAAQGNFSQSVITFDAISTVLRIMDYMAGRDITLAEIVSSIPEINMIRKETDCPWAAKGRVMRKLIEESSDREVELLDGVKVYHDNGWALVLPDVEEPRYHVYSEGYSYEFAESLADFYIDKINQLKNG